MEDILKKIKKSTIVELDQKTLISVFTYYLSARAKGVFILGETARQAVSPGGFSFSLIFSFVLMS